MQTLLVIHNLLRWLIVLFGFWAVLNAVGGLASKRLYTPSAAKSNFFFMLSMDIQFLVGLGLYFVGEWFERLKHLGENMHDPYNRFFTMEHEVMMIVALILVHMGRALVKKAATPKAKYLRSFLFFGIALLLILIATPWPFRDAVARPWFRWF
jgi:hypothetical protein